MSKFLATQSGTAIQLDKYSKQQNTQIFNKVSFIKSNTYLKKSKKIPHHKFTPNLPPQISHKSPTNPLSQTLSLIPEKSLKKPRFIYLFHTRNRQIPTLYVICDSRASRDKHARFDIHRGD